MKRLSHKEFIQRTRQQHGDDIEILGEYINKRTKILVRHVCGYTWQTNPATLWKGHGCPKCANCLPKDTAGIREEVFRAVGDEYVVAGEYVNTHTPILFKHRLCETEFLMSPKAFLHQGQRCPHERYLRSARSNSTPLHEVQKRMTSLVGPEYLIVGKYRGASKKVLFIHEQCGREFEMAPGRFLYEGIRCPHCYIERTRSKGETVIANYLKQNDILFKAEYKIPGCRNVRPLWFDFAVFDPKGSLECLIEYDGSHHFTPKFPNRWENFKRTRINDEVKNQYCKEQDIPLLRITHIRSSRAEIFEQKVRKQLAQALASIHKTIPSQAQMETSEKV